MRLDHTLYPDQWLDLGVEPITHQLEFTVGRNEADRSIILKPGKSHTLMEFDVFHLDGLSSCCSTGRFEHDFVVKPKSKFGHTAEVTLHLDSAQDLGTQDIAIGRDQQIQ